MILGTAERLHALATLGCSLVDDARYALGSNEANGIDAWVGDQAGDRLHGTVHQANNASRNAGLFADLDDALRREWRALGWLQDERVAASDREWQHPHWHHEGEVEWRNAGDHPDREAHHLGVDAARDLVEVLAHEQCWGAAGEVDDLNAAADLARCIAEHLAVLGGDELGERFAVVEHRLTQLEEVAGSLWWRHLAPLVSGGSRRINGSLHVGGIRERHVGEGGLGSRVRHHKALVRGRSDPLPVDVVL